LALSGAQHLAQPPASLLLDGQGQAGPLQLLLADPLQLLGLVQIYTTTEQPQ
jgi:hypothetical protein